MVAGTWNATTGEAFPDSAGRLERWFAGTDDPRTPDAVAVVDETAPASACAGLVARAERVAHGLVARAIGQVPWSASVVTFIDAVVALLGILLCQRSAVYCRLDPAYPAGISASGGGTPECGPRPCRWPTSRLDVSGCGHDAEWSVD